MTLACFQICQGSAMYNCQQWLEGNIAQKLFFQAKVSSQAISKLIKKLGNQASQIKFFKDYIAKFFPAKRDILIDSTALPSAINSSINAFGYANGSIQKNVSCLMLVDQETKLPIYFHAIGGDVADVSTLKTTIGELKQLGLVSDRAILDAGFCSKENLQFMCQEQINFVTRLAKTHRVFTELIEEAAGAMELSKNAICYADKVVFIKSRQLNLYGHQVYVHIVMDPAKKSRDRHSLLKNRLQEELTPQEHQELDNKLKNAGFFILVSSQHVEREDILPAYYIRQSIEQFWFCQV